MANKSQGPANSAERLLVQYRSHRLHRVHQQVFQENEELVQNFVEGQRPCKQFATYVNWPGS